MSIKVAIVEDDGKVRESIAVLLDGTPGFSCVGSFPNAEVALAQMAQNWPEVVLMDINLPKMSGIDCVAKLKEIHAALQIIMLTAHDDNELLFRSLAAGASGYLIKQTPPAEIMEAIVDVQKGGSPMSSSIARKLVQHFQKQRQTADEAEHLSKREVEILSYLAKGYQYKEIGELLTISALTVRSHLRNIYEKLHVRTKTEAVAKFLSQNRTL
jgi:DNA-binding NarL/FixJ family response regulator